MIAVGPGSRDESGKLLPLDVKAGDPILFGKWSGTEVKIDGEDLLIMKESRHHGHRREDRSVDQRSRLTELPGPPHLKTELDEHHVCQGNQIRQPMPATACCAASNCSTMPSR